MNLSIEQAINIALERVDYRHWVRNKLFAPPLCMLTAHDLLEKAMRYVGFAFPKEMVEKTPKPKKGKTYYRRVKKLEECDEDDEQFTENKLSDYYFKPLAETKTIKTPAKMQEFFLLIEGLFF